MKKFLVGLTLLTSLSSFADISELYGRYEGYHKISGIKKKCSLEVSKDSNTKTSIKLTAAERLLSRSQLPLVDYSTNTEKLERNIHNYSEHNASFEGSNVNAWTCALTLLGCFVSEDSKEVEISFDADNNPSKYTFSKGDNKITCKSLKKLNHN